MCGIWLLVGWSEGGCAGLCFVEVLSFFDWWKDNADKSYCCVWMEEEEAWVFPEEEGL